MNTFVTLISQSRTELSLPDVKMWISLTLNCPEFNFEECAKNFGKKS